MHGISGFHAHVYFDADTVGKAREICEQARDLFEIDMGRVHEKAVGPHPRWSCQLAFRPDKFGPVISWLSLHRDGLTVFAHPETGDVLADHRDHAIWMGEMLELNLDVLT